MHEKMKRLINEVPLSKKAIMPNGLWQTSSAAQGITNISNNKITGYKLKKEYSIYFFFKWLPKKELNVFVWSELIGILVCFANFSNIYEPKHKKV